MEGVEESECADAHLEMAGADALFEDVLACIVLDLRAEIVKRRECVYGGA